MRGTLSHFVPSELGTDGRKPTNLSLPRTLVTEAKRLGISVSRACERGLIEEIADVKAKRWLEENREAIASWNDYVETHGLPLAKYRQF
jgi:antitoxin CcdA